ncbi:MAG: PIN domain-containing protein [Dehalococcoidia bacterium]
MRLAVDTSTLVAEGVRARGRRLFAHSDLDLVVAADAWSETEHELRKRVALIAGRRNLKASDAIQIFDEILAAITACVASVTNEVYVHNLNEASRRIPRDQRDAPTVALALTLDCGIWTADYDFFGCGVPVWITEMLLAHLDAHDGQ